MTQDPYESFAERYDWMKPDDPFREAFFRQLFAKCNVERLLDCACGTGRDLLMFHSMGLEVSGSDLSDAMLAQARKNLVQAEVDIPIKKADYRELASHWDTPFDAVLCLSNSINELLQDAETLQALCSMRSVLRPGGILVFCQGQTDASISVRIAEAGYRGGVRAKQLRLVRASLIS